MVPEMRHRAGPKNLQHGACTWHQKASVLFDTFSDGPKRLEMGKQGCDLESCLQHMDQKRFARSWCSQDHVDPRWSATLHARQLLAMVCMSMCCCFTPVGLAVLHSRKLWLFSNLEVNFKATVEDLDHETNEEKMHAQDWAAPSNCQCCIARSLCCKVCNDC